MITIMVTGSRDWSDEASVFAALDEAAHTAGGAVGVGSVAVSGGEELRARVGDVTVLHGANRGGADAMAARWVTARGQQVRPFPPRTWTAKDLLARNLAMVAARPDVVLAFVGRGSRGTWHAANAALRAGLVVTFIGEPLTEPDVARCRAAATALANGPFTSKRQALWVALANARVGSTGSPGLVAAAGEILA